MDDIIDAAAEKIGKPFGMSAEQVITYMAIGEVPHPDAPETDCGVTDPRSDARWCVRPPNHSRGHHNCYVR